MFAVFIWFTFCYAFYKIHKLSRRFVDFKLKEKRRLHSTHRIMWVLVPVPAWKLTNLRTCYRYTEFSNHSVTLMVSIVSPLSACFTCIDSTNHELKISGKIVTISSFLPLFKYYDSLYDSHCIGIISI